MWSAVRCNISRDTEHHISPICVTEFVELIRTYKSCMMGKVFCLYLVLMLFTITVSLYAWLSGINRKSVKVWKEFHLGTMCLLSTATLYQFCNCAHYLSNIVGVEIRDELQLIAPSEVGDDVSQEVNMFLETMVMYPPVVSVSGFANVDRGLFRAVSNHKKNWIAVRNRFSCFSSVTA
ncbi:hypothetical protein Cfor_06732 [Coptotermes formosanus]|uniref:Gustatory receptor n=1 Tax=Coptotermes formosanus TaxID=36987 RepID=A0A6L2Q6K3_COPFO|nr:hypothetical protein Cfor_06732 [Coptotermes formosanus]